MYSDVPSQRMVFIDGQRYAEGDSIDAETVIERINTDGAVFKRRGVRFVIADGGAAADEAERETIYAHLRQIGDYAAKLGITVCFETHRGLCVNHREMLHVMADLAHPSLRLNFEFNLEVYDEEFAGQLARHFDGAVACSQEVTLAEMDGRPVPERLRDSMAKLFSPYL